MNTSIFLNKHKKYVFIHIRLYLSVESSPQEPWFIKLNPNGRIPVVVDRSRNDFAVFETSAILLYLAQHYDKDSKFSFDPAKNPDEYSVLLQWLFFAVRTVVAI